MEENKVSKRLRVNSESEAYTVRRRLPKSRASPKAPNELYVTNKSDFKGQFVRCMKILETEGQEVILHGLGAALPRTVNLALQVSEKAGPKYEMDIKTSTVQLIDDIERETEVTEQTRNNSGITIKIQPIARTQSLEVK